MGFCPGRGELEGRPDLGPLFGEAQEAERLEPEGLAALLKSRLRHYVRDLDDRVFGDIPWGRCPEAGVCTFDVPTFPALLPVDGMLMAVAGPLGGGDRPERGPNLGEQRRDPASPFHESIGVKHPFFQEVVEDGALELDDKTHAPGNLSAIARQELLGRQGRHLQCRFLIFHSFHLWPS